MKGRDHLSVIVGRVSPRLAVTMRVDVQERYRQQPTIHGRVALRTQSRVRPRLVGSPESGSGERGRISEARRFSSWLCGRGEQLWLGGHEYPRTKMAPIFHFRNDCSTVEKLCTAINDSPPD